MSSYLENRRARRTTYNPGGAVVRVGVHRAYLSDLYHRLLTASWPYLILLFALTFVAANGLFAIAYLFDGGVANARPGSFTDAFFFSVQTMATIGYGTMAPRSLVANVLVSAEAFSGMVFLALMTGMIFAKFSRPTARVRFSRNVLITQRDGVPSLIFRMANERANQIAEAEVHVVLLRQETTAEGESFRRQHDLSLIRYRSAMFALSWAVIHPIRENSPLFGATPKSLKESVTSIVVSLIGHDDTFAQTIHARHTYEAEDFLWGARFVDLITRSPAGQLTIDYARFDDVVPADTPYRHIAQS